MPEEFKFVHAADFHLDDQMEGLAELPAHLKQSIANAPYAAARGVFDLAISEAVDFVLLSGDLLDLEQAGCRASAFLLSQFERLAEKNIRVYWCGGEVDYPDRWPTTVELPKNVQTFSAAAVDELVVERRGKPLATIIASGFDHRRRGIGEFIVEAAAPFPIVMTHGQLDSVVLAAKHVRYWALGGQHKPALVDRSTSWVAYPGTPQARRPEETGAHGCHLVRVDGTGTVRTQFIELDSVRWMPQKLALAESSTPDQIRELLTDRALKLISEHPEQTLLVTWQLSPAGEFNPQLRQHRLQQETLKWLRDEFGRSEQGIWSISLQTDPPAALPASWYEEDTILGDYLRALGRYQGDESIGLALHDYLPRSVQPDAVAEVLRLQGEERTRVLSAAGLMGVEYLTANRDVA